VCAFVTLNKRLLTYLLTYLLTFITLMTSRCQVRLLLKLTHQSLGYKVNQMCFVNSAFCFFLLIG